MEVELRDWDQQVAVIKLHCVAKRLEKKKKMWGYKKYLKAGLVY